MGGNLFGKRANAFTEWPDGFDWRQAGVIMDDGHSRPRVDAYWLDPPYDPNVSLSFSAAGDHQCCLGQREEFAPCLQPWEQLLLWRRP